MIDDGSAWTRGVMHGGPLAIVVLSKHSSKLEREEPNMVLKFDMATTLKLNFFNCSATDFSLLNSKKISISMRRQKFRRSYVYMYKHTPDFL